MPTRTLHFPSPRHLIALYANRIENLSFLEKFFAVTLTSRDNWVEIEGSETAIDQVVAVFNYLEQGRAQGMHIQDADVKNIAHAIHAGNRHDVESLFETPLNIRIKDRTLVPKTLNQKRYLQAIAQHDIVFGIGPAGTGKTYLAVASALHALFNGTVDKIILTRPAVESGEALGFLPGDLQEKILPYLRPLYDSMDLLMGTEDANRLISKGAIEIAPLAYMRGRTLSNAFIILDEAQNTTHEQMVMFLTRLGDCSRMVITGDITQVDLPHSKISGLKEAVHALKSVDGISIFRFETTDIVRNPLVQKIVEAYKDYCKTDV